jgi:hypothetical protein
MKKKGRPRIFSGEPTKIIPVRIPASQFAAIIANAKNVSAFFRAAITEKLKRIKAKPMP